eukprot:Sspe_Gene.107455::Locus_85599_Transcript_1_3_Confidence_0.571_Length_1437::g.107455::m.107455
MRRTRGRPPPMTTPPLTRLIPHDPPLIRGRSQSRHSRRSVERSTSRGRSSSAGRSQSRGPPASVLVNRALACPRGSTGRRSQPRPSPSRSHESVNRSVLSSASDCEEWRDEVEANVRRYRAECREWLRTALFEEGRSDSITSPMEDKLLSGALLVEAVLHCEAIHMAAASSPPLEIMQDLRRRLRTQPRTLTECRENYQKAYEALQQRGFPLPQHVFSTEVERVLGGADDVAWAFLWHALRCYPDRVTRKVRASVQAGSVHQGYSPQHMQQLEEAVLHFLFELGVLRTYPGGLPPGLDPTATQPWPSRPATEPPRSLAEDSVLPYLRNGTLLCDIVEATAGPDDLPTIGVFDFPKVKKSCLSNISKALDELRLRPRMSKVYLDWPDEVYNGNMRVILPLLEDIMRWVHGRPPRKHRIRQSDVPYLPATPR